MWVYKYFTYRIFTLSKFYSKKFGPNTIFSRLSRNGWSKLICPLSLRPPLRSNWIYLYFERNLIFKEVYPVKNEHLGTFISGGLYSELVACIPCYILPLHVKREEGPLLCIPIVLHCYFVTPSWREICDVFLKFRCHIETFVYFLTQSSMETLCKQQNRLKRQPEWCIVNTFR